MMMNPPTLPPFAHIPAPYTGPAVVPRTGASPESALFIPRLAGVAGGHYDGARGGLTGEEFGEARFRDRRRDAVGAEENEVAGGEVGLEEVRLDVGLEADGACEDVREVRLRDGVRFGEAREAALAPVEDRRVAEVTAVEASALDDYGAERAGEFGLAVARDGFGVERAVDLRGEVGESAACAPVARTGEAVVGQHFDGAAGGEAAFAGGADAIGEGGESGAGALADEPRIVTRDVVLARDGVTGEVDVHGASVGAARGVRERVQMRAAATAPQVVRQRVFTSFRPMRATTQRPAKNKMPVT